MNQQITIPQSGTFTLANIRLHRSQTKEAGLTYNSDGLALAQITVENGIIGAVTPCDGVTDETVIDGRGGIVMPSFIDCHTHLDKGHIWPRERNPDGSFDGALTAVERDRSANWNASDVETRMDFALRCAHAHGTKAVRTHIDSIPPQEKISFPIFKQMREKWKGRIELQAACLFGIDAAEDESWFNQLAEIVADADGILGAVAYMVPDLDALLDRLFAKANDLSLDLDFHADETDDVDAIALDRIAEAALRHNFEGRVLVGHCCSLARQADKTALLTLDKVAKAGLSVVSLPMCNMYLQDRRIDKTTPRWRGVTLVHEMADRGINVSVASDNTRDPFYAYGDLDMLEVYREATRILQFDHPVANWPASVTANPARAMGLAGAGYLANGETADFNLFRGRRFTELLSRPESDRIVIRDGRPVATHLPDYAELDELTER